MAADARSQSYTPSISHLVRVGTNNTEMTFQMVLLTCEAVAVVVSSSQIQVYGAITASLS